MKPLIFNVGDQVNGCVIIRIIGEGALSKTRYRVTSTCCGVELEYSRNAMVTRYRADHPIKCKKCARGHGAHTREGGKPLKPKSESVSTQVYVEGWGWTLGQMGIRAVCSPGERQ